MSSSIKVIIKFEVKRFKEHTYSQINMLTKSLIIYVILIMLIFNLH